MTSGMKYVFSGSILCFAALCCFYTSCRKIVDPKVAPFQNFNLATNIFDEIVTMNAEALIISQDSAERIFISDSAIINYRTDVFPNLLLVDFTLSGQKCPDRKIRKGAVRYNINPGKSERNYTVIFEDYLVDNNRLSGTLDAVVFQDSIVVNIDGQVVPRNSGSRIQFTARFVRTLISGYETVKNLTDDVCQLRGYATGVTTEGESFSATISTPLVRNLSSPCRRRFSNGVVSIYINQSLLGTLDYGKGECDRKATVNSGDRSFILDIDP